MTLVLLWTGLLPYIEELYSLQKLMAEAEVIAEGVIESTDAQKRTCVIKVTKSHKGKCPYLQIRLNMGKGVDWHAEAAIKHHVEGARAVVFYRTDPYLKGGWKGAVYVNRFFSSIRVKSDVAPDKAWWNWEQIEIMLNRTFNGTADDLAALVTGVVQGKVKPPAPDPKVPKINREDVLALPLPGVKVAESKLPPPFRKSGP